MVDWIKMAFEELIEQNSWMDLSTKTEAKKKVREKK